MLYKNMMTSVTAAMTPSIRARMRPSLIRLRTGSTELKRDRTSPICRFSKNDRGSRIRWWNSRAPKAKWSEFWRKMTITDLSQVTATVSAATRAKPSARTMSRSTSPLAITSSTVTCR